MERKDKIISIRLPILVADKLQALAESKSTTISDMIRLAVAEMVLEPIGYSCEHVFVTASTSEMLKTALTTVKCKVGCTLQPIYEV